MQNQNGANESTEALRWLQGFNYETVQQYKSKTVSFVQKMCSLARHSRVYTTQPNSVVISNTDIQLLIILCIRSLEARIKLLKSNREYSSETRQEACHLMSEMTRHLTTEKDFTQDDVKLAVIRLIRLDRVLGLRPRHLFSI